VRWEPPPNPGRFNRTDQRELAQPAVGDGSSAGVGEAAGAEDEEWPVVVAAGVWVDGRGEAAGVVGADEDAVGLDERRFSFRVPSRGEGALQGWREVGGDRERATAVPNHLV
jgi:hypothetical protein